MQQISKKTLFSEGQCGFNLAVGYIFTIVGIFFAAGAWRDFLKFGDLLTFVIISAAVWFIAVSWGIRKILSMSKFIHNIKVGNMKIEIKKVADIEVLNNSMFDNNCRIEFEDESYTMVLKKYEKLLKVGDECYVFYIGASDEIYYIANTKKYKLDEELTMIFQKI